MRLYKNTTLRSGAVVARLAHNQEVEGAIPSSVTAKCVTLRSTKETKMLGMTITQTIRCWEGQGPERPCFMHICPNADMNREANPAETLF